MFGDAGPFPLSRMIHSRGPFPNPLVVQLRRLSRPLPSLRCRAMTWASSSFSASYSASVTVGPPLLYRWAISQTDAESGRRSGLASLNPFISRTVIMTPDKLVEGFRHPGEPRRHPRRDVGYGPVAPLAALHRGTPPKRLRSRVGDEHYLRVSGVCSAVFQGAPQRSRWLLSRISRKGETSHGAASSELGRRRPAEHAR